ncbi:MAG: amidophosphoribosyltransferase, partial [Rhodospirillales bacterium]|nr:amidophosphoribosyltransferase [Rhodospirillales bacterium]
MIRTALDDSRPLIDGFREECGIFGVFGTENASAIAALGLHALQHRGQEAAGIVSFDGNQFFAHRAQGRVGDSFGSGKVIGMLPGNAAIGHNRYSTSGTKTQLRDIQPIFAEIAQGGVAIAHNGNLTNARTLKRELVQRGCIFQSTMDTEVIVHLIATAGGPT